MLRCLFRIFSFAVLTSSALFAAGAEQGQGTPSAAPPPDFAAQQAAWDKRLQEAKAQRAQAKTIKSEAKARFDQEAKACFREILVTACQQKARRTMLDRTLEARRLDNRGSATERQVRKEQRAAEAARYREEAPQRAEDLRQREALNSAQQQKKATRRQKKLEHIERQTEKGAQEHQQSEKRLQKKRAAHEKRVAEKMEKARRRAAEDAGD